MAKIQIYGDSILRGVTLNEETQRYYINDAIGIDALAKDIHAEVANFSKFGCTVQKGMRLVQTNLEKGTVCDYALVEYGGNDSDFNWAKIAEEPEQEHLSNTPLEKFRELYKKMIVSLKNNGITPVLATLPPVDAEKYFSWICRNGLNKENILHWLGDVFAIYRYQEQYSRAVEAIAAETSCEYIDFRAAFIKNRKIKDLFCSDGIHPSVKGQELINHELSRFVKAKAFQA